MARGTVIFFDPEKGFGFIRPDDGSVEVLAHYSDIYGGGYRSLEKGQKVDYELVQGAEGLKAVDIRPV
ncbi:cold-shock protein [Arthrobacter crystallopoietes]